MSRAVAPLSGGRFAASPAPAAFAAALAPAALHELYAAGWADGAALAGFALTAGALAVGENAGKARSLLWVREAFLKAEAGAIYPPGLVELGLSPAAVVAVAAPDAQGALQAGLDGARCAALAGVVIEFGGAPRAYDLTASRRLALAAEASGVRVFVLRSGAAPTPSAAQTRWRIRAALSRPLGANAPGPPAFDIALLRKKAGVRAGAARGDARGEAPAEQMKEGMRWIVEWSRDAGCFEARSFEAGFFEAESSEAGFSEANPCEPKRPGTGRSAAGGAASHAPDAAPLSGAVVAFSVDRPDAA